MALLLAAFKLSVCHEETRVGHLSSGFAMGIGVLAQFIVPGSPVFVADSSTKANRFWNRLAEADRGNAPRSALSTSRTPRRSLPSSDVGNDPSGQTSAAASAERWEGCPRLERRDSPLRQGRPLGGLRVIGSPRDPAARSGRPAARPVQGREAAEEVEPRRGHKPMEGTSVPGARKGAGRNGPVRRAKPRSRGFHPSDVPFADQQWGAWSVTVEWSPTARRKWPW
jgi:hypothetical protein